MARPGSSSRWQPNGRICCAIACDVVVNSKGLLFYVAHADTAAEVHIRKLQACRRERLHEGRNAFDSATIGSQTQDLGADVHADSLPRNRARTRAIEVEALGAVPINSEFVAMMAGCNVAMSAGLNVGVHAQCGCSLAAEAGGFFRQHIEFRLGFHIEK